MKIALLGYGKMGKTIARLAAHKNHEIVATITNTSAIDQLNLADVAIDFSVPQAAVNNIMNCIDRNIPVVCGTTGWLEQYDRVTEYCKQKNGSFLYASNFSIGVNLFFELNKKLAQLMSKYEDYSVQIEEIHHTQKLDAPSGTAISLAEDIIKQSNYTRWKLDQSDANTIEIKALREADIKGTHTVSYNSNIDSINITHQAHTRDGFALGAILAAEFIKDKKGIFCMKEVLGI